MSKWAEKVLKHLSEIYEASVDELLDEAVREYYAYDIKIMRQNGLLTEKARASDEVQ